MGGHHSIHSQATENGDESSSESDSSQGEGGSAEEEDNTKVGKSETETLSDKQEASKSEGKQEHPHTQDTLNCVSQLLTLLMLLASGPLMAVAVEHLLPT